MKKLTYQGYIIEKYKLSEKEIKKIKKDLTIKPSKMGNYAKFSNDEGFEIFKETDKTMIIPKYYGIKVFGKADVDEFVKYEYEESSIVFKGKLREDQEIITEKIINGMKNDGGGILVAGCGKGKTNMAIYIACKMKCKTLFVVHKDFLKNQVIDRIKSITNIENVGIIQGKKIDTNSDFVVGMIQSISKLDKYEDEIFKQFEMIIIDEVHHMGAKNFSKFFQRISAKYTLGISAEKNRADGTYKLINWYMGPFLHVEEQKPNDMVIVKKIHYKSSNKKRTEIVINKYIGEPDRSTMISNLVEIKKRNRFVINIVTELFNQNKNVLCLTGRKKQVNLFYKLLNRNEYINGNVGIYMGGMSEKELSISGSKQIIIGTFDMAQEGLDIPNLNAVILCTPKSSIKQSVGRILRKESYEDHPIVIDMIDDDNIIFKKQSDKRTSHYINQKYNIQDFYFSDYDLKGSKNWNDIESIKEALLKKPIRNYIPQNNKKYIRENIKYEDIEFLDD